MNDVIDRRTGTGGHALRRHAESGLPVVTIHVGDIHVSRGPVKIKTLLGSCVSVCLHDPATGIGGMNHFLLPGVQADTDLSTRYGVNAMERLINEMMKLGANRSGILAKVFGGADIFQANHPIMKIGRKNVDFVHRYLDAENIRIVSERTGGANGMVVKYHPHTFEVYVKKISNEKFRQIEDEELSYGERTAEQVRIHEHSNIVLF